LTENITKGYQMAGLIVKQFATPDESRTPPKTKVDVVSLGTVTLMRATLQPGWVWSECVGPFTGETSCQSHHVGCVESGKMVVKMDDGTEMEIKAGDAYVIDPGHDGWVVGDEPFVGYEFDSSTAETYAK
tara:strand:+ start:90 stop:479 length:390 start_codon:yes stop_codon:yes gene_type:complete